MALFNTSPGAGGITPDDYTDLIVEPIKRLSVALDPRVTKVIQTTAAVTHVPIIREDAQASWVAEGAEISPSDAVLDELEVRPAKVAGISRISRELANDSTSEAAGIVGESLSRDIARKIDQAFFGALPAPAPRGLEFLTPVTPDDDGHNVVGWGAGDAPTSLDPFAEAIAVADDLGTTITAFVTDASTALAISKLRVEKDSNLPLLGVDATGPTARQVLGIPLIVTNAVADGTVWALDANRALVIMRSTIEVAVSNEAYFGSDSVAVRAIARVGFAFPSLRSLVKIQTGA